MIDDRHEVGGRGGDRCRRRRDRVHTLPLQPQMDVAFVSRPPRGAPQTVLQRRRREKFGHHGAHRCRKDDDDGEDAFPVRLHEQAGRGSHRGHGDGLHEPGDAKESRYNNQTGDNVAIFQTFPKNSSGIATL